MKEMAHLTCVEEAVVVEGVEVEEIITMEGSSTMEMVGGKMGKDMVVDGMTGVVLVEEGGDEEEVVAVTVDVVVVVVVIVAVLHHKNSVVIMIMVDPGKCLLPDVGVGVVFGGEEVVAGDVAVVVGISDQTHHPSKL